MATINAINGNQSLSTTDAVTFNSASITNIANSGIVKAGAAGLLAAAVAGDADQTLPTQTGNTGKYLTTDGTNSSWGTVATGGLTWTTVTGTTQAAAADNGYLLNNIGGVTVTLPTTIAVGSIIRIVGIAAAGGWTLAQNAGQTVVFGISTTTTGVGGSLSSTASADAIELVCTVANTDFQVISSIGNITVV